jgi:carbonic anhydrase/acetyltransferase-like protein (isoleucine patch superfamily)
LDPLAETLTNCTRWHNIFPISCARDKLLLSRTFRQLDNGGARRGQAFGRRRALEGIMAIRPYRNLAPQIAASAYIDAQAAVIGDVVIGADSSVWPMCVLRGDVNRIRIGARTNIQDGTILHGTHPQERTPGGHAVVLGDDVTVGHLCVIHGCTIEDRCLVGMGSTLMDGALLRSGVFLGAGSLVPEGKVLDGGFLWLGRPARKVRPLNEQERALFDYLARHYVELKNGYGS